MSKSRIWLLQLPVIALFSLAFLVVEWGDDGSIHNQTLRTRVYPSLRTMAGWATDRKFRARGARPARQKIVIVEIDDQSIAALGRWPWHRDAIALLLHQAFDAGAKVVGLDIIFPEADTRVPEGIAELLKEKGLGDEVPKYETDLALLRIIDLHRDRLVLAWLTDRWCRPAFPDDRPCAVTDPVEIAGQPKGFEKFSATLRAPGGFDQASTALVATPDIVANIPIYEAAAAHAGHLIGWPDSDGVVRRTDLAVTANGRAYPSLSLEMARVGLGEDLAIDLDPEGRADGVSFVRSGRTIPVSPLGSMKINFRGRRYHFPYLPALELLGDEAQVHIMREGAPATISRKELLKDAYVLLGVSAIGANDLRTFPFGTEAPGVEGHATILDNLLSDDMLRRPTLTGRIAVLLLMTLGALLLALLLARLDALPAIVVFVTAVGALLAIDLGLFAYSNIDVNSVFLLAELQTIFFLTLAVKYVLEERSKKFIRGAFSKYLAPAIVDAMLKDPDRLKVGGEKKELTILFTDLRGFSTFSEKMDAPVLGAFLNDYLGMITDVVFDQGGTLDKYMGDAVMAFWGAPLDQPDHAARACRAAVKMADVLAENRARYLAEYGIVVAAGVGLNTGPVNVGNMGSERIFEYTVIGDDVNLASRIEGITKFYRCGILTTRATLDAATRTGEPAPAHRVIDQVKVKGKKNAVEIVELLARPCDAEGLRLFQEARQLYQQRRFDEAAARFAETSRLLATGSDDDGPSALYMERCKKFAANPPPDDWDGAWEMQSK
ncbi:MAG: adenylate/guanylate cyclase domain-containing protein [Myxococcales bacterium]|nr:adenylate/guanylate cyclase domain-containing protein [Myxococcales bacterium]